MVAAPLVGFTVTPAAAAPTPNYVVAGDLQNGGVGAQWGLIDGIGNNTGFFSDLRTAITDTNVFGPGKLVDATFTIRSTPVTTISDVALAGIDVYFSSARTIDATEAGALRRFVQNGHALILNSNAPGFLDDSGALGFTVSPRVVFGDGPSGFDTTHRATRVGSTAPASTIVATSHPIANGPFGVVTNFNNWHTVAGFSSVPVEATSQRFAASGRSATRHGPRAARG